MGKIVTQSDFAELLGVSPRTVYNWMQRGMPHDGSRKKGKAVLIDAEKAFAWMIQQEIEKQVTPNHAGNTTHDIYTMNEEKRRLTSAKRRKAELDHQRAMNEILHTTDVHKAISEMLVEVCAAIDAVTPRIIQDVRAAETEALAASLLEDEHRRIRENLAARIAAYKSDTQPIQVSSATA